jgi:hypothetical protein
MITVVLELTFMAGIWNNNVFPMLILIIINTGLSFCIIAFNTGFCNPQNYALAPYMFFNAY